MAIKDELEQIRKQNDGLLRPVDVVAFAEENKDSELHKCFVWDDKEAAFIQRLETARVIIRKVIITPYEPKEIKIRAYTSVPSDRINPGGGYRPTVKVLSDAEMCLEVFQEFRKKIRHLKTEYSKYTGIKDILDAAETSAADLVEKKRQEVEKERKRKRKADDGDNPFVGARL